MPAQPPDYPAEPWQLRGDLHAAALLVPLPDVPLELPPGCAPIRFAGRAVVGAVWVDYRPGGVLAYREVMVTVLVRRGVRVLPHVVAIWVDSPASRDGGRALWGIPKELAEFDVTDAAGGGVRFTAGDEKGPIAAATVRIRRRLPGRWPARFSVVQTLAGRALVSPVRARGRLGLSDVRLVAEPAGPLGFLAGRRPVLGFSLLGFDMSFGATGS